MIDQIISTQRGKFGKFQVTLPLAVKMSIMDRIDQSGLRPSEYMRISLILGSSVLAKGINENQISNKGGN